MGVQETNLELKPKKVGISVTTVGSRRSKNHQDVDLIKTYRKQSRKDRNKQKSGSSKTQNIEKLHAFLRPCLLQIKS